MRWVEAPLERRESTFYERCASLDVVPIVIKTVARIDSPW